jgi:hypothetical protein
MYPSLQMDVPNVLSDLEEPVFDQIQQDVEMVLYFDNLQDYDNTGEQKTLNTIEQIEVLRQIARNFMANFSEVIQFYDLGFSKQNPRYTPRTNLANDRLITLECVFTLTTELECVEDANKMDLNSFPATVEKLDIENWKA